MKKLGLLYEGKAKKVYKTDSDLYYIVSYKDDATAFNGQKKGTIKEKGVVNNKMSGALFMQLEEAGIPTHFVEYINDRESLVKAVKIIPVEVIVRNVVAGSFAKRMGLEEGQSINSTILEFCYKDDALGDPLINHSHIFALNIATEDQIKQVEFYTHRVNDVLKEFFKSKGIVLVDFKLEFGLVDGKVILADEISPDTCRLWDMETGKKLDKDRFRQDLGQIEEIYMEVLNRIEG
jgi:phosphoribosylaminoimidazole-succinocarboxamide synthase